MSKKIGIVYFAYINPEKNWKKLISGQIKDVKSSGIFEEAALYVVVSNPFSVNEEEIKQLFNSLKISDIEIEFHTENKFEYYGIHKLWELGINSAHRYLTYFHTKGMSYKGKYPFGLFNDRCIREIVLTHYLFKDYKKTVELLDQEKFFRAGVLCNNEEPSFMFTWFNFFWASSEYVKKLVEPEVTTNRFYYESWNSQLKTPLEPEKNNKCYSLYFRDYTSCTPDDSSNILARLRKIYKYTLPFSYFWFKLTLAVHSK
ncbi:hypothetical protein SAMN02910357_02256 [Succinivibrio dextrinosolvens]|uniref:hypothetical protein n=1 Tax=Succinivibrio dextrinosolvens TaxID=83771 RepID=UPI0008E2C323|nr:hypothetical protein [Succinivibrio dextrinosolvens]SFS85856.1 hypothetical protein SAMN02910357_02256 [Succinivibrio dextrinosolvens]